MATTFSSYSEILQAITRQAFYRASIRPDTPLYHYTTIEGLRGILSSGCLWATEYQFLNDQEEFRYVERLIPEVTASYGLADACTDHITQTLLDAIHEQTQNRAHKDSFFVACFSLNSDNLTLWAEFAADCGVNLRLPSFDIIVPSEDYCALPGKVVYSKQQQIEILRSCFSLILNERQASPKRFMKKSFCQDLEQLNNYLHCVALLIRYYSMYFKHPLYYAEEEYRIVYILKKDIVKYRESNGIRKPYIETALGSDGHLPVQSIRSNPKRYGAKLNKIYETLRDTGHPEFQVEESEIWLKFCKR